MGIRLLIGNLSLETTEADLEKLFSNVGSVQAVELVLDPQTGRKKGFAFVEMSTVAEAHLAIKQLDGEAVQGRLITINSSQLTSKPPRVSFLAKFLKLTRA
jgi:RNA recognition motif-containing protein